MPSNLLLNDNNFPVYNKDENPNEQIKRLYNYVYALTEQLRYTLSNIGVSNFNDKEVETLAEVISEPLLVKLEGMSGSARLSITEEGLLATFKNDKGDEQSELIATSEMLSSSIKDEEDARNSAITQLADSIELKVSGGNGENATITLTVDGVDKTAKIRLDGFVTFSGLASEGETEINGSNIITGTIKGVTFHCMLEQNGQIVFSNSDENATSVGEILLKHKGETDAELCICTYENGIGKNVELTLDAYGILNLLGATVNIGKDGSQVKAKGEWDFSGCTSITGIPLYFE